MTMKKKLLIALVLPQLAGAIGGLLTAPAISTWYQYLIKPSFAPPNWVFAPVWTTLYLLMGLSWYLAWQKNAPKGLFLIHLAFNSLWSILFFGLKNPGLALVEIIILWGLILAVFLQFRRYSKLSAWLLVPYLLWVTFAACLNLAIFQLNFL